MIELLKIIWGYLNYFLSFKYFCVLEGAREYYFSFIIFNDNKHVYYMDGYWEKEKYYIISRHFFPWQADKEIDKLRTVNKIMNS